MRVGRQNRSRYLTETLRGFPVYKPRECVLTHRGSVLHVATDGRREFLNLGGVEAVFSAKTGRLVLSAWRFRWTSAK